MDNNTTTSAGNLLRRSSLGKKIRKNRAKQFPVFASAGPGFSQAAQKEAGMKLPEITNLHITKGGISFNTDLEGIIKANLLLGVPSGILVRLNKFRAQNFDELFKNTAKIPFELFFKKNALIKIRVSSRKSKLIHTKAVEDSIRKALSQRLEKNEALISDESGLNPELYVRISSDNVTVSVDSSGEPLHKRGLKKFISKAPLRENIAAAALIKSGYKGENPFFDPMSGTGTFAVEAALFASSTPPGYFRRFSFEDWPLFNSDIYESVKQNLSENIKKPCSLILASDIDPENLFLLKKNLEGTHPDKYVMKYCADFFLLTTKFKKGTIALNPPYGLRLGRDQGMIKNIEKKLKNDFKGFRLILTIPKDFSSGYFSGKNFDKTPFVHGGIEMNLFTGKI
ncbi:MAG: THUMP domain-containing class I SAM-dependent RNA methyltransferase [Thermodesulfobacteriota bacterium]